MFTNCLNAVNSSSHNQTNRLHDFDLYVSFFLHRRRYFPFKTTKRKTNKEKTEEKTETYEQFNESLFQ